MQVHTSEETRQHVTVYISVEQVNYQLVHFDHVIYYMYMYIITVIPITHIVEQTLALLLHKTFSLPLCP